MKNALIIVVLVIMSVLIVKYLIKEKKKGAVCVGCPYSGKCPGHIKAKVERLGYKVL